VSEERPAPPRCRPLPPGAVEQRDGHHSDLVHEQQEAVLLTRLGEALSSLPEAERTAVVAAIGYAGGPVGAAMELGLELEDADALTRSGLQLLRAALDDLDAHGAPRDP
jgi:DNA-directed RNA polymerase specialized sigma24 family protein